MMFHKGATHDARWRIGWISFSPDFTQLPGRGLDPLLVPPPTLSREPTDIAFSASIVTQGDRIAPYYALEDRMLRRAWIGRYAR